MKKCKNCGKDFKKSSTFCSLTCKVEYSSREIEKEVLEKSFCLYCGSLSTTNESFCSEEHKHLYEKARKENAPIHIKINDKTTISTRKYDKIPELIAKYTSMQKDVTRGAGGFISNVNVRVGGYNVSGDIF